MTAQSMYLGRSEKHQDDNSLRGDVLSEERIDVAYVSRVYFQTSLGARSERASRQSQTMYTQSR